MYVIVVLQSRCVGVFVVCLHTRFHLHSSSVLLFTVVKPNTKDIFTLPPCCYFTLSKNITYPEVAYFSKICKIQSISRVWSKWQ